MALFHVMDFTGNITAERYLPAEICWQFKHSDKYNDTDSNKKKQKEKDKIDKIR